MFVCSECDHYYDDSELSPFMAKLTCNSCAGSEEQYL